VILLMTAVIANGVAQQTGANAQPYLCVHAEFLVARRW
jgi:hypothetical protein